MANIKKLQAYAAKLRAAGMSEAELRRAVDQLEKQMDAEEASGTERAPAGISAQRLAGLNLERASEGKAPLKASEDDDDQAAIADMRRDLSFKQLASINFERALNGQDPLTANDIASMNLRRAVDAEPVQYAKRGMNATRLARENLDRACRGEPALLPHPSDSRHQDDDEDEE